MSASLPQSKQIIPTGLQDKPKRGKRKSQGKRGNKRDRQGLRAQTDRLRTDTQRKKKRKRGREIQKKQERSVGPLICTMRDVLYSSEATGRLAPDALATLHRLCGRHQTCLGWIVRQVVQRLSQQQHTDVFFQDLTRASSRMCVARSDRVGENVDDDATINAMLFLWQGLVQWGLKSSDVSPDGHATCSCSRLSSSRCDPTMAISRHTGSVDDDVDHNTPPIPRPSCGLYSCICQALVLLADHSTSDLLAGLSASELQLLAKMVQRGVREGAASHEGNEGGGQEDGREEASAEASETSEKVDLEANEQVEIENEPVEKVEVEEEGGRVDVVMDASNDEGSEAFENVILEEPEVEVEKSEKSGKENKETETSEKSEQEKANAEPPETVKREASEVEIENENLQEAEVEEAELEAEVEAKVDKEAEIENLKEPKVKSKEAENEKSAKVEVDEDTQLDNGDECARKKEDQNHENTVNEDEENKQGAAKPREAAGDSWTGEDAVGVRTSGLNGAETMGTRAGVTHQKAIDHRSGRPEEQRRKRQSRRLSEKCKPGSRKKGKKRSQVKPREAKMASTETTEMTNMQTEQTETPKPTEQLETPEKQEQKQKNSGTPSDDASTQKNHEDTGGRSQQTKTKSRKTRARARRQSLRLQGERPTDWVKQACVCCSPGRRRACTRDEKDEPLLLSEPPTRRVQRRRSFYLDRGSDSEYRSDDSSEQAVGEDRWWSVKRREDSDRRLALHSSFPGKQTGVRNVLFSLPIDLLTHVSSFMWPMATTKVMRVCKQANIEWTKQVLWKAMCARLWSVGCKCSPRQSALHNWRAMYRGRMRLHRRGTHHICLHCGCCRGFKTEAALQEHLKGHKPVKNTDGSSGPLCLRFRCEECGRKFEFESQRTRHQRGHGKGKLLSCEVPGCRHKCRDHWELKVHTAKHTGNMLPHHCGDKGCSRSFRTPAHLRRHKERFQCPHCDWHSVHNIRKRPSLAAHIATAHLPGLLRFWCAKSPQGDPQCKQGFYYKSDLRKHIKEAHVEAPVCMEGRTQRPSKLKQAAATERTTTAADG